MVNIQSQTTSFRFAHLSDLHFSHPDFGLKQFLSKKWVGNWNFILRRKREFDYSGLEELIAILVEEKVALVVISGDLSCTSSEIEFRKALCFIEKLERCGIEVLTLPGNHDQYTKKAYRNNLFYQFFPSSLQKDGFLIKPLSNRWTLVALDTALATPLFRSHGRFGEDLEKALETVLSSLSKTNVILANHFPILPPRSGLQREKELIRLLKKFPNVKLYLHGHLHQPAVLDLRSENLPVIVDSGSATHRFLGGWNLIECKEGQCFVTPYKRSSPSSQELRWMPQNTFFLQGS